MNKLDALLVDVNVVIADDPPPATAILSLILLLQFLMSFSDRDGAIEVDDGNEGDDGEEDEDEKDVAADTVMDTLFVVEQQEGKGRCRIEEKGRVVLVFVVRKKDRLLRDRARRTKVFIKDDCFEDGDNGENCSVVRTCNNNMMDSR